MRTPLYEIQKARGGRFIDFGGWDMPVQFSGGIDEHMTVRTAVGMFDVSHMGEVRVTGKDAVAFVDYLVTANVKALEQGLAVYTMMCLANGGIVDDLIVYREPDAVFLVINAGTTPKDVAHIKAVAAKFDVKIDDVSNDYALLAIQGPKSNELLQGLVKAIPEKRFSFVDTETLSGSNVRVARTGYTGELGVEIFVKPSEAEALFIAAEKLGAKPCGLGARDSLRLEKKMPLYGNDIDETTTPLEASLSWAVKMDKPDFMGKAALTPPARKWVGIKMLNNMIPRRDYPVLVDGKEVGKITSGTMSPSLKMGIGCVYLPLEHAKVGTKVEVMVRGAAHPAEVCKTPFL